MSILCPTRDEMFRENVAAQLVCEQEEAAEKLIAILADARAKIAALDFPLGCPVVGYDKADLLADYRVDVSQTAHWEWERAAWEIAEYDL